MADAILSVFINLEGVFAATESAITVVKVTEKRKVGPVLAKRLFSLLHP